MRPLAAIAAFGLLAAACGTALSLAGCGPKRRDEPFTQRLVPDDPRVAAGQQLFSRHCYQCHPGGSAGLGPGMNDKPLPVALMKTQVREGLGTMPAFSKQDISDEQLDELIRYLKALRSLKGGGQG